jgi:uncharacterized protein YcfL
MKKLLFSSLVALAFAACGTSEESVKETATNNDSTTVAGDSLNSEALRDSTNAIIHGSQDQEKVDSIKKAKQEEGKKK